MIISSDHTHEIVQTSVPENEKTGPVSGLVRGTLTLAGWVLKPTSGGTDVTYVVKGACRLSFDPHLT